MSSRTVSYVLLHMRSFSSILNYIRHHLLIKLIAGFFFILLVIRLMKPNYFSYGFSYTKIIIDLVNIDMERQRNVTRQEAQLVWDLHHLQRKYMNDWCKGSLENIKTKKVAWVVSMSGNSVVPGAVVVGHSIKKLSCYQDMIALVTETVNKASRAALESAGFSVYAVEALDCNWMDKQFGNKFSNKGIPGTHTRFHAWRYTQYETMIYLDTDLFPLINMDELFDSPGDFSAVYCARPGVLDPCFNAGLAVFKPSLKTYHGLMEKWEELTHRILGCPNDQVVLWYFFAFSGRWNRLPYSYNVRRKLFYPMKAYHFAGYGISPKPWELERPPTEKEVNSFRGPAIEREDMNILWWEVFYEALKEHSLHDWWKTTEFYKPATIVSA